MINILRSFQSQVKRGKQMKAQQKGQELSKEEFEALVKDESNYNRKVLITTLTGATAVIHIALGGSLFILNGLGFLALLAAHEAVPKRESYRKWTREGLLGYTGFTVLGYMIVKGVQGWVAPIGILTKLIELGLIRVLWVDGQEASNNEKNGHKASSDGVTEVQAKEQSPNDSPSKVRPTSVEV